MLFIIFCEDKPNSMALRMQTRPAHLDYIQPLVEASRLLCAGPTPHYDPENTGKLGVSGSLIIAEFETLQDAQDWAANDPYALAGLFSSVLVKPYLVVLPKQ